MTAEGLLDGETVPFGYVGDVDFCEFYEGRQNGDVISEGGVDGEVGVDEKLLGLVRELLALL